MGCSFFRYLTIFSAYKVNTYTKRELNTYFRIAKENKIKGGIDMSGVGGGYLFGGGYRSLLLFILLIIIFFWFIAWGY